MQNLVIVESPTKARTLAKYLGKKYQIEASMGHIRDLPKSDFGIDIDHNFEPRYIIPRDKRKKVNELKKLAEKSKVLYLATDPDREGEAIAWHLSELVHHVVADSVDRHVQIRRVVFHEITPDAIKQAFEKPRNIDLNLVDAQQARRVLDRIVGYKLSPLLWEKIKRGLSAGRVQTVTLRLVVEREKEIEAFKPVEYWTIEADLAKDSKEKFLARVIEYKGEKIVVDTKLHADEHLKRLDKAAYIVESVSKKDVSRSPHPPFTTSTLQQTSGNKLGFSAKKTMMIAQNLYEHGLITYMRTDSVNLSNFAVENARSYIETYIGKQYLPESPRYYKSKSKNAQEAHEAIRPTNLKVMSDKIQGEGFTRDHKRLYDLIWKRMVACQMQDALLEQTGVDISATPKNQTGKYKLHSTGSILKFDGWLKIYGVKQIAEEDLGNNDDSRKQILPELSQREKLDLLKLLPNQHFTEPPPRFTEASLIKKLEELGIGRPSTYAPILSTIQERYYVEKSERKFIPTSLGVAVNDFLIKYFPEVFDYTFTASMEDYLDDVSRGERKWQETIKQFYTPFEKKVEETSAHAKKVKLDLEKTDKKCPLCGKDLVIRIGRFGKFLACSGFPDCKHTQALEEEIAAKCSEDGGEIVVRKTKKGRTFYGCKNYPKCKFASWTKPKSEKTNKPVDAKT